MELNLCLLNEQDIPALIDLAKEIGWGYNTDNWKQFFRLGVVMGHKGPDGNPVSSAVMIKYVESLRWLTSFIVSPRFQRRGLARELWGALNEADGVERRHVGLVSTEEGLPFYLSIGFKQLTVVHKYVRVNGLGFMNSGESPSIIKAVSMEELDSIIALDEAARGVRRSEMLLGKLRSAKSAFMTYGENHLPNGFALAVMEGELLCIGPVVAPDEMTAAQLIIETAKNHHGPVRIDLLAGKSQLCERLEEHGFALERVPPVLSFAGRALPQVSENYMALAAQALG